jgi:hypothetical protein
MKKTFLLLVLFTTIFTYASSQNGKAQKKEPLGKWKFEAPYAPEGYRSGTMSFLQAEKKFTAEMTFTGMDYKFVGEKVKFENDTITFSIYLEGQAIEVFLKLEEPSKMSGKAVYSEGTVPLSLVREISPEASSKTN